MTSSNDYDRRLYALFNEALDLVPDARLRMLDALRAEEPLLADRLARMLEADVQGEQQSDTTASLHAALAGALDPSQPGELPARIGGYRIEGKLGEGGMGVVYLARREGLADAPAVALKLISERLRSSAAQERFIAEQRSLARLDHPSVCRFIDADTLPDGRPLVVMEAVGGLAVDAWVATERPSVRTLLGLFIQLLSAVAHAHERLIVHRDIKCSNILVTSGGQIKLLDFGIAKLMDEADTAQATATSDRFMTPGIAAPEYWARGEVTVATDISALGALLYRLLGGHDPLQFEGLKPTEIERRLLFVEPDPLSKIASPIFKGQIGSDLEAIVHKCLRKSPSDRYGSADALAADLRRFQEGFPVQARTAPLLYRTRLFLRRNRVAASVASVAVLTLLAWSLSLSASLREVERQREEAVRAREASDQIAQILESAIVEADPARRSIENIGAREIMDAAAERIEPMEATNPELFARLSLVISRIERSYGRNREALEFSKRGYQSLKSKAEPSSLRDELRLIAASSAALVGQLDEARSLLSEYPADGLETHPLYAMASSRLHAERGEYDEALRLLENALAQESNGDIGDQLTHELRWAHAAILQSRSEPDAALKALEGTLRWQRKELPDTHAWVLETRIRRLGLLHGRKADAELDVESSELLDRTIQIYGANTILEAFVISEIGALQNARGNVLESSQSFLRAARIRLQLKGAGDTNFLLTALNVGLNTLSAPTPENLRSALEVVSVGDAAAAGSGMPISPLGNTLRLLHVRLLVETGQPEAAIQLFINQDYPNPEKLKNEALRREIVITADALIASPVCQSGNHSSCTELNRRRDRLRETLTPPDGPASEQ